MNAIVDTYEPPMPPKVAVEQALNLGKALDRRVPADTGNSRSLLRQTLADGTTNQIASYHQRMRQL